jgi:FKBP-type peptidyl-prolyl cis-trans isomerase FkpA
LKTITQITTTSIAIIAATLTTFTACKSGGSFEKLKPGLEYKLFKNGKGELVKENQWVTMHIIQKAGDSVFMSTYKQPGNAVTNIIQKGPGGAADYSDIFFKMRAGDSAVIRLNKDSIFRGQMPPFIKKTDEILVILKLESILGKAQQDSLNAVKQQDQSMQQEQMQEAQKKQMQEAAKLMPIENKKIQEYAATNKMQLQKTANGVYYAITTAGTGAKPTQGQDVTMNYTGMTLDGKKFDSNVDPAFNHVQPFNFKLGMGQVIPGWDEGIANLPVGTKATLLIPSYMAYGAQGSGDKIAPNSVLRFDVEVVSAK